MALPMDVDSWLDGWTTMAPEDRDYLAAEIADELMLTQEEVVVALDHVHARRNF